MVESRSCVQREGVYCWFSCLTSAQRVEFLCGLLDLCVPIELRFLGSCLEDLARKDYHSLRDAEIKANNPADLSGLTNITDEVVRSKLLVSLALLGSDSREAAGVLYRTLTHIHTVINNYGLALNDGRTEEQFLLLFTMAANHPAFSFHQKQVLRQQLGQIQDILQANGAAGGGGGGGEAAAAPSRDQVPQPPHYHHQDTSTPPPSPLPAAFSSPNATSTTYLPPPPHQPSDMPYACFQKNQSREVSAGSEPGSGLAPGPEDHAVPRELLSPQPDFRSPPPTPTRLPPSLPAGSSQDAPVKGRTGKAAIERVLLRRVTHTSEDANEYVFEVGLARLRFPSGSASENLSSLSQVSWSDGFVSPFIKTQQEVAELMSQLSRAFPDDGLEELLPPPSEVNPRCLTALPCHVLQHPTVQLFFPPDRPLSPNCPSSPPSSLPSSSIVPACSFTSSSNLGCMLQNRGENRAVYRVASVQPVVSTNSSVFTRSTPHLSSLLPPPLPPPSQPLSMSMRSSDSSSPLHHGQPHSYPQSPQHSQHLSLSPSTQLPFLPQSHSQLRSQSQPASPTQSLPNTAEQNGILDWLRRLRLHKYYPVFKQLTMEKFLALTEEDLNKYDLTQGAKKKLKTQLELQKSADREMKMEKHPCSSVARVMPSSYMGPPANPLSAIAGELRVDVDSVSPHHPASTDSSSSSGYSSSSCSPRTLLCCDNAFDRNRDVLRCLSAPGAAAGATEKSRPCLFILNSSCPTGSGRPTAQVLPVQTDPAPPLPPSGSSHPPFALPFHPQPGYPQSISNPARIVSAPRKPRPPPLCTEDRTKPLGAIPVGGGFGSGPGVGVGVAARLENQFTGQNVDGSSGPQESTCRVQAGGLMVETSSALTSTSNSLHHVSQPPLLFHLSSSPSGYCSYPPPFSPSCTVSKPGSSGGASGYVPMATANTVPMAAVPGNAYYQPTSCPAPSVPSASPLDQSSAHSPSTCVCSSCGCHGNCGAYGALPGYAAAGYLQPFSVGPSIFTLGPLLHLSPFLTPSSVGGPGAPPFSYPTMAPPPLYRQSPTSHDQQQSFGFYQPHSLMGNGGQKRGAASCCNCGAAGHQAEDCKQPPMDSTRQGTFRLKFASHSQTKDSGD
nr:zinc finger CCHC domain-containing protein 14 isoform X1 [Nothobranchius furzeri]